MQIRIPFRRLLGLVLVAALLSTGCGGPQETISVPVVSRPASTETQQDTARKEERRAVVPMPAGYDTVQTGRFDRGKMWTFVNPPAEYFEETYGFTPTDDWLTKAQRGALQFGGGCSASFVSARGLVMTNHHCAREYVVDASRKKEDLLDEGFSAQRLGEEREADALYVDQLVRTEDVTAKVFGGLARGRQAGSQARERRISSLEEKMTASVSEKDTTLRVEIQQLYRGARYAAHTYRRYSDVRIVMVPQLRVGYFGGSPDNFTYPRFALDVAFFRVYGPDGEPLEPEHYFSWDTEGATANEPVFAVGHPASTSRLDMISQFEYKRDYDLPNQLEVLRSRRDRIESYMSSHPDSADIYDLRNTFFTIENSIKSLEGQLRGLKDPYLMARRAAGIRELQDSIMAVDSLRQTYSKFVQEIRRVQESKRVTADKAGAFVSFSNPKIGSRILVRALHGYYHDFLRTRGAAPDRLQEIRREGKRVRNWPSGLEEDVLHTQLERIRKAYGQNHPTIQRLFRKRTPQELASHLVRTSALTDSSTFVKLLDDGYRKSDDSSVRVIEALAPMFLNVTRQMQDIRSTEERYNAKLSRARFAIFGAAFPPDANGSLRVSDGRVKSYRYNGTVAPPFTNFYGMYDRYFSHNASAWALPPQWVRAVDSLDLGTPLNLVSTNDISGGSSGSPLLNQDLEVVGLVFDSNIEGLPNEYLYRQQAARAVSVDVRGILEALQSVYDADRLLHEIRTGTLPSEEDASEAGDE